MKKLLNTLYVLTPESALFCRNENICIRVGGTEETGGSEKLCVPAISIDAIVCFGRMSVSTPLLEFCGQRGISVTFLTDSGRLWGGFTGRSAAMSCCESGSTKCSTIRIFAVH